MTQPNINEHVENLKQEQYKEIDTKLNQNWCSAELGELGVQEEIVFEKRPALKFKPNTVTEVLIDFSAEWAKYQTTNMKQEPVFKAIIPCVCEKVEYFWWLNKRNPIYRELLKIGESNIGKQVSVRILQTGSQATTKYVLVK